MCSHTRTLFEIDQYFMKGGKVIVLAEPVCVTWNNGLVAMVIPGNPPASGHYGVKVGMISRPRIVRSGVGSPGRGAVVSERSHSISFLCQAPA